ncbi:MAG: sulfatase [Planctomycetota bacterium JB042]
MASVEASTLPDPPPAPVPGPAADPDPAPPVATTPASGPLRLLRDPALAVAPPILSLELDAGTEVVDVSEDVRAVLVPVPADVPLRVSLGLAPRPVPPEATDAAELFALPIAVRKDAEARARIVEAGRVPAFGGPELSVAAAIRRRLAGDAVRGALVARRDEALAAGGREWLTWTLHPLAEPDVLAVVLRGARFGTVPAVLTVDRDPTAGPSVDEGGVERRIVDGEERVSVRLGPRARHAIEVTPAERPREVTFGIATEGAAAARWRLLVDGRAATGVVEATPGWTDVRVPWPDAVGGGRAVEVAIENRGDAPFLLAQPIVRAPPAASRPSLLLISLDTLRADHLSCYGYARPTSPFLDRFAGGAVRFEHCLAPSSHTLPSHASLLTGRLPVEHGVVNDGRRLDARLLATLPAHLAAAGYATAAWTGGGYVSTAFGFSGGFDRFFQLDPVAFEEGVGLAARREFESPQDLDDVAAWIEARDADGPWFAFVHTYAIHGYRAPADVFAAFDREPEAPWRGRLDETLKPDHWRAPGNAPSPADVRHLVDLYDASIRAVDARLEAFLDRLDRGGRLDDAVVVVTSDHGEEFLEHGGLQHALTLFEEQLRIPLLVRLPGAERGRAETEPLHLVDLAPTLLDRMGLPPLAGATGVARPALLDGAGAPAGSGTPWLFSLDRADARATALRSGRFKVIHAETGDAVRFPASAAWRLFDLREDEGERHDLAPRDPVRLADLRRRLAETLDRLRFRAERPVGRPPNADVEAELRALGYTR